VGTSEGPEVEEISAERVSLVVIPSALLAAIAEEQVASESGGRPPRSVPWPEVGEVPGELVPSTPARMRIDQLREDPSLAAWLVRAIVVADQDSPTGRRVVGHLGGHGAPEEGVVEIGYTVAEAERGKGLATEAAMAWFGWAHEHGAIRARLSTTPDNVPSRAIARRLGLAEVGGAWDADDECWELVHEGPLPIEPSRAELETNS
jgi:RimJ/RimL family protein N-acetyltransferase